MKLARRLGLLLLTLLGTAPAFAETTDIAVDKLEILGITFGVTPSFTANVDTPFELPTTFAASPEGLTAVGDLTGPGIVSPIRIETTPGQPFRVPGLAPVGTYILQNVRIERYGGFVQQAAPSFSTITVEDSLETSITVTQLTPEQLRARGIVVDLTNYDVYEYTVTYLVDEKEVEIPYTVIIDKRTHQVTPLVSEIPFVLPPVNAVTPPRWTPPATRSFELYDPTELPSPEPALPGSPEPERRSIPAAIVLPNSLAVLHDFFSVMLIVSNGASENSGITLNSVSGLLRTGNTLRVAGSTPSVAFGQPVPVMVDGNTSIFVAKAQGKAEWVVEALKSGTWTLDIEVSATMRVPNQPDIPLKGVTSAAINVVDPRFSITFSHPDSVLAGEEYSTFAFITNTSIGPKTLTVNSDLPICAPQGSPQFYDVCLSNHAEVASKNVENLGAGKMEVVEYRLRSTKTGSVFATAGSVSDSSVVSLSMGLSSTGLSPASLVMPYYARFLDSAFVSDNVRLLGFGYGIANAPVSAATSNYPRVIKTDVFSRAVDIARAGQRIFISDSLTDPNQKKLETRSAYANLTLDLLGNAERLAEWDQLRRTHEGGVVAATALARELQKTIEPGDDFKVVLDRFAEATAHRRAFAAALVHGGSAKISIASGNALFGVDPQTGNSRREVAFAEILGLQLPNSSTKGELAVLGRFEAETSFVVTTNGPATLELLYPGLDGAPMRYTIPFNNAGAHVYRVTIRPGSVEIQLVTDGISSPSITPGNPAVALPELRIAGARQDLHLDAQGHKVAVLFNRPISVAGDIRQKFDGRVIFDGKGIHYEGRRVIDAAALQQDSRIVVLTFAQALSTNVTKQAGSSYSIITEGILGTGKTSFPPRIDNDRPAAMIYGQVLKGDNTPITSADVILHSGAAQYDSAFDPSLPENAGLNSQPGSFFFESIPYDPINGYSGNYTLRAVLTSNPGEGTHTSVTGAVHVTGDLRIVNLQFLGRGAAEGYVRYDDGSPVVNARVVVGGTLVPAMRTDLTDAQGFYSVSDLPVGPITFSATDELGNVAFASGNVDAPGAIVSKNLSIFRQPFPGTATVRGIVRLVSGAEVNPIAHARVGVFTQGYGLVDGYTDAEGRFEFTKIPAGSITVLAEEWNVASASAAQDFEIGADQIRDVSMSLPAKGVEPFARVEGDVIREEPGGGTTKVAGALVKIDNLRIVTADANGHYVYDAVPVSMGGLRVRAFDPVTQRSGESRLIPSPLDPSATNNNPINIPLSSGYGKGTIRIRLLDVGGNPVSANDYDVYRVGALTAITPSPETGLWIVQNAPVGQNLTFYAVPKRTGFADQQASGTTSVQFDGHIAGLTLRLSGKGRIRVALEQGGVSLIGPVAVDYYLWSPATQSLEKQTLTGTTRNEATGLAGFASFDVPALTSLTISNSERSQGFATASRILTYDGQSTDVTLVLSTRSVVRGRVVNFDGVTPMSGAIVRLLSPEATQTTATKPDGSFEFASVISAASFTLVAEANDGVVFRTGFANGSTPANGGIVDTLVMMRRQGRVTARVVYADRKVDPTDPTKTIPDNTPGYEDNAPVPFAKFWLREFGFPQRSFGTEQAPLEADRDGRFSIANIFEGSIRVTAQVPTDTTKRGDASAEIVADNSDVTLLIGVNAGGSGPATITVKHSANNQTEVVPNAEVSLIRNGGIFDFGTTDGSGSITFHDIPAGFYDVSVFSKSKNRSGFKEDLNVLAITGAAAEVFLERSGTVTGEVVDPEKAMAPVIASHVDLTASSYITRSTTGADGRFSFEGVREGSFVLQGHDPNSNRKTEKVPGFISQNSDAPFFRLEMERLGTLRVAAFLPDDFGNASTQVAPLAEITVQQLCHTNNFVETCDELRTLQGPSDFTIEKLLLREFKGTIREIGGAGRVVSFSGTLTASATPIIKVFPARGDVRVTVLSGGAPVPNAKVTVSGQSSTTGAANTDASGIALIRGIALGDFSVQVLSFDGRRSAFLAGRLLRQSIPENVTATLADYATITGTVLTDDGSPSIGTRVETGARQAITDGGGRYSISGLAAGSSVAVTFFNPDDSLGWKLQTPALSEGLNQLGTVTLDSTYPVIVSVSPADGAMNVPLDAPLQVLFSEPVSGISSILLTKADGTTVAAQITGANVSGQYLVTIKPSQTLQSHTSYRLFVPRTLTDNGGHQLSADRAFNFTTSDKTEPEIVRATPVSPIPVRPSMSFLLSEPVMRTAFTVTVVKLTGPNGAPASSPITMVAELDPSGVNITAHLPVNPSNGDITPLEEGRWYRFSLNGLKDLQDNPLTRNAVELLTADSVKPVVVITSPSIESGIVAGLLQTVKVRVANENDPQGVANDIDHVEYYQRSGSDWALVQNIATAPDFAYTFRAPENVSTYAFSAIAVDRSGNRSARAEAVWTVHPDLAPANVAVALTPATVYGGTNVTAKVSFTDEGPVATVKVTPRGERNGQIVYHGTAKTTEVSKSGTTFPSAVLSFDLPVELPVGTVVTFTAEVLDSKQQKSTASGSVTTLEDTFPPQLQVNRPTLGALVNETDERLTIEVIATDGETGMKDVRATIDGIGGVVPYIHSNIFRGDILIPDVQGTTPVAKTVVITATDRAGQKTIRTIDIAIQPSIKVDAPVVRWSCPTNLALLPPAHRPTLRIFATPAGGNNVREVRFYRLVTDAQGSISEVELGLGQTTATQHEYMLLLPEALPSIANDQTWTLRARATTISGVTEQSTIALTVAGTTNLVSAANATIDDSNRAQYDDKTLVVGAGRTFVVGHHEFARIIVTSGGELVHQAQDAGPVKSVDVKAGSIYVECGAAIHADKLGYSGAGDYGMAWPDATVTRAFGRAGGSHGGAGAIDTPNDSTAVGGSTYGSLFDPNTPGAAGGGTTISCPQCSAGGGVVRLKTIDAVVVDGRISADGYGESNYARGAGGSIRIDAGSVSGSGFVRADGASDGVAAGGGGRVAIYYSLMNDDFRKQISAYGGTSGNEHRIGAPGTVYLKRADAQFGDLLIFNRRVPAVPVDLVTPRPTRLTSVGFAVADEVTPTTVRDIGKTFQVGQLQGIRLVVNGNTTSTEPITSNTVDAITTAAAHNAAIGESLRGRYRFDSVTLTNAKVEVEDLFESSATPQLTSATLKGSNLGAPVIDPSKIRVVQTSLGYSLKGESGAITDPDGADAIVTVVGVTSSSMAGVAKDGSFSVGIAGDDNAAITLRARDGNLFPLETTATGWTMPANASTTLELPVNQTWSVAAGFQARTLAFEGNWLAVASKILSDGSGGSGSVVVFNTANPTDPLLKFNGSQINVESNVNDIELHRGYLYVASNTFDRFVITGDAPVRQPATNATATQKKSIAIDGGLAYVATTGGTSRIEVYDISNPQVGPQFLGFQQPFAASGSFMDLQLYGADLLFGIGVAPNPSWDGAIFTRSNFPSFLLRYQADMGSFDPFRGRVNGDYGYLVSPVTNQLGILQLNNTAVQSKMQLGAKPYGLDLIGDELFLTEGSQIVVMDVSDKAKPVRTGSRSISGSSWDVRVAPEAAYVAAADKLITVSAATPARIFPTLIDIVRIDAGTIKVLLRPGAVVGSASRVRIAVSGGGYAEVSVTNELVTAGPLTAASGEVVTAQILNGTHQPVTIGIVPNGDVQFAALPSGLSTAFRARSISIEGNSVAVSSVAERAPNSSTYTFGTNQVVLYDIQNGTLANPRTVTAGSLERIRDAVIHNGWCYVASGDFRTFRVANPANAGSGSISTDGYAVEIDGVYAFVSHEDWGRITVFDVSNPQLPVRLGSYNLPSVAGITYTDLIAVPGGDLIAISPSSDVHVTLIARNGATLSLKKTWKLPINGFAPSRGRLVGNKLLLGGGDAGLVVLDIDKTTGDPVYQVVSAPGAQRGVATADTMYALASGTAGVTFGQTSGSFATNGTQATGGVAWELEFGGSSLFVATDTGIAVVKDLALPPTINPLLITLDRAGSEVVTAGAAGAVTGNDPLTVVLRNDTSSVTASDTVSVAANGSFENARINASAGDRITVIATDGSGRSTSAFIGTVPTASAITTIALPTTDVNFRGRAIVAEGDELIIYSKPVRSGVTASQLSPRIVRASATSTATSVVSVGADIWDVKMFNGRAYLATSAGLKILSLADNQIASAGSYPVKTVATDGKFAFATYDDGSYTEFEAFDVSNPLQPAHLSWTRTFGDSTSITAVEIFGPKFLVGILNKRGDFTINQFDLVVVDRQQNTHLPPVRTWDIPGFEAKSLRVHGGFVHLTDSAGRVAIVDLSNFESAASASDLPPHTITTVAGNPVSSEKFGSTLAIGARSAGVVFGAISGTTFTPTSTQSITGEAHELVATASTLCVASETKLVRLEGLPIPPVIQPSRITITRTIDSVVIVGASRAVSSLHTVNLTFTAGSESRPVVAQADGSFSVTVPAVTGAPILLHAEDVNGSTDRPLGSVSAQ